MSENGEQTSAGAVPQQEQPAKPSLPSPIIPLTGDAWTHVYEPAEDTFLFMDAMQDEMEELMAKKPRIIVEIGCGSGSISAMVGAAVDGAWLAAGDVNPHALGATAQVLRANNVTADLFRGDLLTAWRPARNIDVLLFNPPYVPTPTEEITSSWIARSWAGGEKGREVTDRLLADLEKYLSPSGCLYLVALDANDPQDIARVMAPRGFRTKVVKKRRAGIERLLILKIFRA